MQINVGKIIFVDLVPELHSYFTWGFGCRLSLQEYCVDLGKSVENVSAENA